MAFGIITGAVLGGLANLFSGERANRANEANVNSQIGFQREMSETQYQRAVADMRAAGLNPMLAYSQGGNASPAGAAATNQPVDLNSAVTGATQGKVIQAQLENLRQSTVKSEAESRATEAAILESGQRMRLSAATASQVEQSLKDNLEVLSQNVRTGRAKATLEENRANWAPMLAGSEAQRAAAESDSARSKAWVDITTQQNRIDEAVARARLQELQVPGAEREAEVNRSAYGHIRPFIKDGALGGSVASGAAMADWIAKHTVPSRRRNAPPNPRGRRLPRPEVPLDELQNMAP